jgi:predicted O-linked N-acetylglucosamine transferase (SPINDLY family)
MAKPRPPAPSNVFSPARPSAAAGVDAWRAQALALHGAGRLAEAEAGYRAVLGVLPQDFEALHGLGVVGLQTGHAAAAVGLLEQAVAVSAGRADAWSHLGLARQGAGDATGALAAFDRALALQPGFAEAHSNRASALLALQRPDEALAAAERALASRPDSLEATFNAGLALHALARYDEALARFDAVLGKQPDIVPALLQRARALHASGRLDEALAGYDAALARVPDLVDALYGRGDLLVTRRRFDEAIAAFDRCLALARDHLDAWLQRGNALQALGRHEEALAAFDEAARRASAGSSPPAIPPTSQAAGIAANRAGVLLALKRYDEASAAWDRVLALAPDYPDAEGQRLHADLLACRWDRVDERVASIAAGIAAGRPVADPFAWCGIATSPMEMRRCAEIAIAARVPAVPAVVRPPRPEGRRLRIGYLCGEFRNQATSILMTELWERHDATRFERFAFDNGWDDGSTLRRRIDAAFDEIVPIANLDDDAAARAVADRGIDVLVHLNGFFGLARHGVFARRPAPVQVNFLGYPGTLGASWMDYLVADRQVVPPGEEGAYVERVVRLPDTYQPNDRQRRIADRTPTRDELGLPADGFVFCCFNNTYKILPAQFAAWMRVLAAVPGSVLWLLDDTPAATANLRREAAAAGVDPVRLVFAPRVRTDEHLARHRAADLFLDTLPYNAHTTGSDALWAGLPVLSCAGTTFPGRVGASLLQAAGLADDLLAVDAADYERRAVALARDPARLGAIRAALARAHDSAPLFDTARFTAHLEAAFEAMHARAQAGLPPEAFDVAA